MVVDITCLPGWWPERQIYEWKPETPLSDVSWRGFDLKFTTFKCWLPVNEVQLSGTARGVVNLTIYARSSISRCRRPELFGICPLVDTFSRSLITKASRGSRPKAVPQRPLAGWPAFCLNTVASVWPLFMACLHKLAIISPRSEFSASRPSVHVDGIAVIAIVS